MVLLGFCPIDQDTAVLILIGRTKMPDRVLLDADGEKVFLAGAPR